MHLLLTLHALAARRGDGLRPGWLELLTRTTCADAAAVEAADLSRPRLRIALPGDPVPRHQEELQAAPPEGLPDPGAWPDGPEAAPPSAEDLGTGGGTRLSY